MRIHFEVRILLSYAEHTPEIESTRRGSANAGISADLDHVQVSVVDQLIYVG